ncbi:unnamed protein product [Allacma fusca]|uniref:Uncharacterized protein n=1 Tax=Allacma fusca TaxID=39272 RepID=A0A8J2JP59_9HEXA|nr:unnamed protein product [Allacma fusca]
MELVFPLVPKQNPPKAFKIGPKDLGASVDFPESTLEIIPVRKPRKKQQAEHVTSDENLAKLSQKDAKRKSNSSGSSSEEKRETRSSSQASMLKLRSGKRF